MKTELLSRYLPYFKMLGEMKLTFGAGLLCSVVAGAASGFGLPFMLYKVFPVIFADPQPGWVVLIGAIALFPAMMLIRGLTSFFSLYFMSACGVRLLTELRMRIHLKLQRLPLAFFHKNTTGDLFSRVMQDTGVFQKSVVDSSIDLIKQPVQLLGAVGALVYLSIQQKEALFFMLFVGIIPVVVVPLRYVGKRLMKRASQLQDNIGALSHTVTENISAAREVRAFNLQDREMNRFERVLKDYFFFTMKTVKYSNIMRPSIEFVSSIGIAGAITYVIVSKLQVADLTSLFAALYMTYEPVKKFGEIYNNLKRGEAALDRVEYILDEPDTVPDASESVEMNAEDASVVMTDVWFKYIDEWVLRDVNLEVSAGEVVALVGPSGAGKSTMADLIPRFYDVNKGAIFVGGRNVKDVSKLDLRDMISVVSQDTFLFNATIEENIRLGRQDATDLEIRDAARAAFANEFIGELEQGYETVVGDRGVRLSGGQKQRIAIARAFLKNAPILILDEATSALDSESEEKIQQALEDLVRGKTVFVIAHRFSTIRNADRIVVLEDGAMVGHGSHEDLYPSNAVYKRLYDRQFAD